MKAPLSITEEAKGDAEEALLLRLINGYQISHAIYAMATLGIPDLLGEGARSSEELAALTGSHSGSLYRLLRMLASVGVLTEDDERRFSLTSLGSRLRSDATGSRSAWAKFLLRPPQAAAWGAILHSVRTGENAFCHVHGADVWTYRTHHRDEGEIFDLAMRERSAQLAHTLLQSYDFAGFKQIVDVGGGDGTLLAGLLSSCPDASGTLFDLAPVVAGAAAVLRAAGVSGRCAIVAGSFFEGVPSGGDAYLLKSVLHDWDEHEALAILANCHRAMTRDAKLLIVERIVRPPNEGAEGKLSDLNMLVITGGRERTLDEFVDLLARAKFVLEADIALAEDYCLIEAKPMAVDP